MSETNKYLAAAADKPVLYVLTAVANYITDMLRVFGLVDPLPPIGFSAGGAAASLETTLAPYLDALAAFRETGAWHGGACATAWPAPPTRPPLPYTYPLATPQLLIAVRDAARAKEPARVLRACDELRDDVLPLLGVVFEDAAVAKAAPAAAAAAADGAAAGGAGSGAAAAAVAAAASAADAGAPAARLTTWKLRPVEELKREMEDKRRAAEDKARVKAEAAARAKAAEAARRAEAAIPPTDYFRSQTDKYAAWDEQGIPTTSADGKALSDKARRKAEAAWAEQDKKHKWFLSLPPPAAE